MTPTPRISVVIPPAIRTAAEDYCAKHGIRDLSTMIRLALCDKMGKPELLDEVKPEGRPKETKPKKTRKKRTG